MHDAALVRVERAELLIGPAGLRLLGENFAIWRSSMSLPFRYSSASTNTRLSSGSVRPNAMSTTCCSAFERLAAMPHENLGFVALRVQPRAVRRLFDVDGGVDAERRENRSRN